MQNINSKYLINKIKILVIKTIYLKILFEKKCNTINLAKIIERIFRKIVKILNFIITIRKIGFFNFYNNIFVQTEILS